MRITCKGLEFFLGFLSIVFCLGESIFYKVNVMLQFSGALTLRQQLDWKKNRRKSSKKHLRCLAIPNTWKNSFWFFRKRGPCRSDNIVCNCFDDSRTNLPKKIGQFHRKQNTKFQKRRWVRSKNVFLSVAMLFSLVVTKENCFENFLRSLYLNNTCFLFKCRVAFRLR